MHSARSFDFLWESFSRCLEQMGVRAQWNQFVCNDIEEKFSHLPMICMRLDSSLMHPHSRECHSSFMQPRIAYNRTAMGSLEWSICKYMHSLCSWLVLWIQSGEWRTGKCGGRQHKMWSAEWSKDTIALQTSNEKQTTKANAGQPSDRHGSVASSMCSASSMYAPLKPPIDSAMHKISA